MQVQTEIKKLKAEKDAMMAKLQSAQAKIRIQEQLEGLSVDNEVKALDNVREHIKNTIAQANLEKELGESSLDQRLTQLRAQSGAPAARPAQGRPGSEGARPEEDDVARAAADCPSTCPRNKSASFPRGPR